MSKRRKEKRVPLPYLPQNIMEDIFHKLSCRDMARSKLVCNEWNSIISSTKFMGNHLIVLDYNIREDKSSFYTSSYSNLIKEQSSLSSMTLPVKDNPEWCGAPRFLGSYNGLVAISLNDKSILWNPLTQRYSSIPISVLDESYDDGWKQILYGLCYDGGRDEYSVVVWSNYQSPPVSPSNFDGDVTYETLDVNLYNFKDGSVRTLEWEDSSGMRLFHKWLYCRDMGKVICGLPHWVVQLYDFIDPFVKNEILYFDVKDEKFKQMPLPYNSGDDKRLLGLATIDDENNLGCVFHDKVSSSLELWVMKEYGNEKSWTNLSTIPYVNVSVNRHRSIKYIDVLGFMPNGDLLLYVNGKRLWIYDFQKGNCQAIKFKHIKFNLVISYQPKLISPPKPLKRSKNRRRR